MCPFRYIGLIEASTLEITLMPASALHSVDDNLLYSFYLWRFFTYTLSHKYDFRFVSRIREQEDKIL